MQDKINFHNRAETISSIPWENEPASVMNDTFHLPDVIFEGMIVFIQQQHLRIFMFTTPICNL
jgi:hypothetical protein